jgi:AmiR/NasT family two-component response regulator
MCRCSDLGKSGCHAGAVRRLRTAQERAGLANPYDSRWVIEEAVRILMERYEMNADRAFAFLARAWSHGDTELRAVAQELIDERNRT